MVWDFKTRPELPNSQVDFYYWESPHKQIFEDFEAEVVNVHDGDTITLNWSERNFNFPLRFLDIDAPEIKDGGETARDWLKQKIEGKLVDIIINRKNRVGKYGRLLGKVMFEGLDLGEQMINLGLAKTFENRNENKIIDTLLNLEAQNAITAN